MLEKGTKAPAFELPDDRGNTTTLETLLADGPLILYFYPADFTPGCTREACSIRDLHSDLLGAGLNVVGISPQDSDSHARFREENDLPFILLSDTEKVAIRDYDVDGLFGIGVRRATYLIGEDGTIEDAVLADVIISKHEDFIRKAIELHEGS